MYNSPFQPDITRLLLSHPNTDVNIQNKEGSTALMLAVLNNYIATVQLLAERQVEAPYFPSYYHYHVI